MDDHHEHPGPRLALVESNAPREVLPPAKGLRAGDQRALAGVLAASWWREACEAYPLGGAGVARYLGTDRAIVHRYGTGEILSSCGAYRYRLWRQWGSGSRCTFICLNPSTADADKDDNTLRRMLDFARGWGHGRLDVVNLFAFRATQPRDCFRAADPVGPEDDQHITEAVRGAARVIVAWGAHGYVQGRGDAVLALLQREGAQPHALRLISGGYPEHPLYLPGHLRPFPYEGRP